MNDYYKDNLSRLRTINEEFADKIDSAEYPHNVEPDKEDNLNFIIKHGDRVKKAYDIKKLKEELNILKSGKFYKGYVTVLVGIGNGETLKNLLKQKEDDHIVVAIEPLTIFIKNFMEKMNLKKYQKNGSLVVIQRKEDIAGILTFIESKIVVQGWMVGSESYIFDMPNEYFELLSTAKDLINQIQCNVGTVIGAGVIIAENDIKNLPYVIRHKGVECLRDLYKGKCAVTVSTGPSLQKNIHILRKYRNDVVIIAVAQALRALLAYDIKPDFICTVDYGKTNIEHFEGLFDTGVNLVALNRSYAGILKRWKGKKFITVSDPYGVPGSINDFMAKKGTLPQGGSVSHLCVGLAIHLGCKNIALIGQDLGYEGSDSHTPLADASGKIERNLDGSLRWDVNDPQSHLKGTKNSMGLTKFVTGYFDDGISNLQVETNMGLESFITSFESIAESYKNINFYNCTEGGAKIKGYENKSLREYIKHISFFNRPNKNLINKIDSIDPEHISDIEKVCEILKNEVSDMELIIEYSKKALSTCKKMLKRKLTDDKLKVLLKENEDYSKKAQELTKKSSLLGLHIYKTSREIQSRELNVNRKQSNLLKNKNDLKTRIKRNEMILNAAIDASKILIDLYNESIEVMEKYLSTKDEGLLCETEVEVKRIDDKDIEQYFSLNNWAYPLVYARHMRIHDVSNPNYDDYYILERRSLVKREEAIKNAEHHYSSREKEIKYAYYVSKSKEICKDIIRTDKRKFNSAKKLLKKAISLFPDKYPARWGLATTLHHLGEYKESAKLYEKMIKDFEDNNRIKFEYSLVLLEDKNKKGFKILKDLFSRTTEFDHYLFKYGILCENSKMEDEAINAYKRYLEKFPDNYEAKERLKKLES